MARATLTISSKNYSSWSLRGWLLCRMAGLDFDELPVDLDDPGARQELLLLSPSVLVPRLTHGGVAVWDTLAIAEYLNEIAPEAGLLPADRAARAHCRAVSGEIHSGLLQPALGAADEPQGAARDVQDVLRRAARRRAHPRDLDRMPGDATAGRSCSARRPWRTRCTRRSAPGSAPTPSRSSRALPRYCDTIFAWPLMQEWTEGALAEPDEIVELEVEF